MKETCDKCGQEIKKSYAGLVKNGDIFYFYNERDDEMRRVIVETGRVDEQVFRYGDWLHDYYSTGYTRKRLMETCHKTEEEARKNPLEWSLKK